MLVSDFLINFAMFMKMSRIIGLAVLGVVWLWLCRALVVAGGGVTLKNLFIITASGIIIFVPLWRKYFQAKQ